MTRSLQNPCPTFSPGGKTTRQMMMILFATESPTEGLEICHAVCPNRTDFQRKPGVLSSGGNPMPSEAAEPMVGSFVTEPQKAAEEKNRKAGMPGAAGDWLCAWCLNPVANEKDRLTHGGRDELSFTNPEGQKFTILIFSKTVGCVESGQPTFEHTWFPGCAWSYCLCARCRIQIGWFYSGSATFAGLIKDRIVKRICIT
ncbi:MAG: cereblon family protein, partial [Verrucomicrobiae bacterium]|nr:cereblon family protein [Verrucomicrobiae bacterium]